jgi:hypothetical protein
MAENLEISYGIPSIEHIKALYDEVIPLLKQLKTKADVIEFGEKHKVTMEINYDLAKLYDEKDPIEVIRCEAWGDLTYIYVYKDGSKPKFDVWSDFYDSEFIEDINIDDLKEAYRNGIQILWFMSKNNSGDLEEIILTLHNQGMSINDIFND